MNNTNKDYYKRVYGKVYASDELKERLMNMKKSETKIRRNHRVAWKAAVAAAVVAVALPTGVYAAARYWGLNDFLSQGGQPLSQEAKELIETDIPQERKDEWGEYVPVEFTVKEALCDGGSVNILIEARAKERGKYLLAFEDSWEEAPVADLGIEGEQTIGEYAAAKGLTILYVGTGFDWSSPFSPDSCSIDGRLAGEDDVLNIGITAYRKEDQKNLHVVLSNAVQTAHGETPVTSKSSFELSDKSSGNIYSYTPEKKMKVKGTPAVVTKVTAEETAVNNYVDIYYTSPVEPGEDDELMFRMRDRKDSDEWQMHGGQTDVLGDGKYCCHIVYPAGKLPETCILEAFNYVDKTVYQQFKISLSK